MVHNQHKTALVTGANSGLGFEAAAQLAEDGYGKIILACRSLQKAQLAGKALVKRVGRDVFAYLEIDTNEPKTVKYACKEFTKTETQIDYLLLNAGVWPGSDLVRNNADIDITYSSCLIGHHVMVMELLKNQVLSSSCKIVISGSELARRDDLADLSSIAKEHFSEDLEATFIAAARSEKPFKSASTQRYGLAKRFVVWWMMALAEKLPPGMTINAVSPGIASGTDAKRHQTWLLRFIMAKIMPMFGLTATVADAARRYLDAAEFGDDVSGQFFASAPGKFIGKMEVQQDSCFFNKVNQEACWNSVVLLAEGSDLTANHSI